MAGSVLFRALHFTPPKGSLDSHGKRPRCRLAWLCPRRCTRLLQLGFDLHQPQALEPQRSGAVWFQGSPAMPQAKETRHQGPRRCPSHLLL